MAIFKIPLSFVGSECAANFKFISVGLYQTPICAKVSEKCQIRSKVSPLLCTTAVTTHLLMAEIIAL